MTLSAPAPDLGPRSLACAAAAALAVAGFVAGLERLRRVEARLAGRPTVWFGYARDGVNLCAALALVAVFVLGARVAAPTALLVAGALVLGTYCADWLVDRRLGWRPGAWLIGGIGATAAAALVCFATDASAAVARLVAEVAPH